VLGGIAVARQHEPHASSPAAARRTVGSSVLHIGQVGDAKKRACAASGLRAPPIFTAAPDSAGASSTGAASPVSGPLAVASAPSGASRSCSTPTWRASAATTTREHDDHEP
jgi:hypothetical protein